MHLKNALVSIKKIKSRDILIFHSNLFLAVVCKEENIPVFNTTRGVNGTVNWKEQKAADPRWWNSYKKRQYFDLIMKE